MNITKKKHLEIAIESIPSFKSPKIELEQYTTPAPIVADILWNANALGDIANKSIMDLGCGTGIFALSSLILGAKSATGIDIDVNSVNIAKTTADKMDINNSHFFVKDVNNFDLNCNFDTAITNPPFGSQYKAKKGADRAFMKLAIESADVSYSFHMAESEEFVINFYKNLGGKVTHKFFYNFPLVHSYDFHSQESREIDVIVLRVVKIHEKF
ncbi:MAG: METTL5 family protein [Methanobrevibacter sp.]|nr:METTL5 family protein [Methanobrevibacter sp.]